jgi:hypothetical protein
LYSSEQAPASINGSSEDYILFDDHDSSENEASMTSESKSVVTSSSEPPLQGELPATERLHATSGSPREELPWLEQPSFFIHPRITALQKQGLLLSYFDVQVPLSNSFSSLASCSDEMFISMYFVSRITMINKHLYRKLEQFYSLSTYHIHFIIYMAKKHFFQI